MIAGGDEADLQAMNSQMRRIDLFCKLVSPLVTALLDGFSSKIAIAATLGVNAASVVLEYGLIAGTYRACPALGDAKERGQISRERNVGSSELSKLATFMCFPRCQDWLRSLAVYCYHPAFLPSLALSLLYLTVLSFSGQMVTYLLSVGLTSTMVGLIRTVSVAVELSATWIGPRVMAKLGPTRAGMWFLSWQAICLCSGVAFFWLQWSEVLAASILVASVILSRAGLWGYDLCAQIIIQEVRHCTIWQNSADACRKSRQSIEARSRHSRLQCRTSSNFVPSDRPSSSHVRNNSDTLL